MEFELMNYVKEGGIGVLVVIAIYFHRDLVQRLCKVNKQLEKMQDKMDLILRNGKR